MAGRNQAVGGYGERVAVRHLREVGMTVLARNWRCEDGEIDIVARDGPVLVACEVKTRTGWGYEHPLAAVTAAKAARLRRLAQRYAALVAVDGVTQVRVDLVAVVHRVSGRALVEHVRGAC